MNVRFFSKVREAGKGEDGLPIYQNVEMVEVARSPNSKIVIAATDEHRRAYRNAYETFVATRDPDVDGFPLAAFPGIDETAREACKARGILTVEALVETDTAKAPVEIQDAAERAARFLEAIRSDAPQLAATIEDQKAEIERQAETIDAQKFQVEELKADVAKAEGERRADHERQAEIINALRADLEEAQAAAKTRDAASGERRGPGRPRK